LIEPPVAEIATWGSVVVFSNVLLTRLGVPVPAIPVLVFAGSAIGNGTLSFTHVLFAAVVAALIGDGVWFSAGRRYGRRLVNGLARFSLTVDTSVRHTRALFERYGFPIIAVCKFVPGLALATPPLMGTTRIPAKVFVVWDAAGTIAWASFWLLAGALFERQLASFMQEVRAYGATIFHVIAVAAIFYVGFRLLQRLRFRMRLVHMQVTPGQLDAMMQSPVPPVVVDARPPSVRDRDPWLIPGAMVLDLATTESLRAPVFKRSVVVYCLCRGDRTSRKVCEQLHREGFSQARTLNGGLDEWRQSGYPVRPLTNDVETFPASLA
jgi:membrane protein DedA with SNARE-associated domain/rhodanese-related sulfurtransferase